MKNRSQLIDRAIGLMFKWHKDLKRKGDSLPDIVHLVGVATILASNGFDKNTIAAGFCHDLLEDTSCAQKNIEEACGKKVLKIVKHITNDPRLSGKRNWEKKKLKYIKSVKNGPNESKAICLADKIHNLQSLISAHKTQGVKVWKKFNRGKKEKLWFEKKVYKMISNTHLSKHPLLTEYKKLITIMETLK